MEMFVAVAGEEEASDIDGRSTSRTVILGVDGNTISSICEGCSPSPPVVVVTAGLLPLTFLDEAAEFVALLLALPNQCGKPCLKLNPPGGNRSSSVALTVSVVSAEPVVNVYVVNGTSNG